MMARRKKREFTLITWNKALLLTGLFLALKFLGVIHWSWLWVFFPLWITTIIIGTAMLLCIITLAVVLQALRVAGKRLKDLGL